MYTCENTIKNVNLLNTMSCNKNCIAPYFQSS